MKGSKGLIWFAGTDEIRQMGPFDSHVEAWAALILTADEQRKTGRKHAPGAYVWVENKR